MVWISCNIINRILDCYVYFVKEALNGIKKAVSGVRISGAVNNKFNGEV